jgi:putative hydrolase of the HAD superfamily
MGPGPVTKLPATQGGLRAIVFDLDGTLYQDDRLGEEVHQSACRYVAFLKGVTVAEAEDLLRGARCEVSESGGTLSRAVLALGGDLKELHNRFSREVHPKGILALDPRVPELLRKLAGRFELYLYTNNNRELSARIMEQIGVGGFFKKVFSIEDYWLPKPDHAALQGILEAIGRKPGETLFVGDRYEVDLEFPASLGCAVFEARTVDELLTLVKLVD